jgi:cell division protease FtsH
MLSLTAMLWTSTGRGYQDVPYSPDFLAMIGADLVKKVDIVHDVSGLTYVQGEREALPEDKDSRAKPKYPLRYRVNIQPTDRFQEMLESKGIYFRHRAQNPHIVSLLYNVVPMVLIFGLLYFLFVRQMRSAGNGAMSFGKSRARLLNRDTKKVTFANVAGIQEAKEEVQEIIEYLKEPQKFQRLGGRIPKGVLLVGPPGTGKTLLAKAIAGEANVPFFSISGSDFVEMFVGVGASRVRDMFEQGKKNAPCIIFIDEIDAVGRSRFTGIGGGHDEREQTLNALLVEMDGFETSDGVIIVAATNRPDVLDQALLRPGRFDRQIVIDLPSLEGRVEILKVHSAKVKLAPDADLRRAARGTPGFSGADLANLMNEAALLAARQDKAGIDNPALDEARDKVMWGRERRSRGIDEKDKRITAFHEAGHAVVTALSPEADPLHKVTIIPRGMALGSTMFLPEKDITHLSRTKLYANLTIAMGGRVAEELFLSDICTGARQDLTQATALARAMVCDFGMSESLGPRTFGRREELMFLGREVSRNQDFSDQTALRIDTEVDRLVREAHDRAKSLLESHRAETEKLVELLLDRETVDGRDAEDIIRFGRIRTPEERGDPPPPAIPAEGAAPADAPPAPQVTPAPTDAPPADAPGTTEPPSTTPA